MIKHQLSSIREVEALIGGIIACSKCGETTAIIADASVQGGRSKQPPRLALEAFCTKPKYASRNAIAEMVTPDGDDGCGYQTIYFEQNIGDPRASVRRVQRSVAA